MLTERGISVNSSTIYHWFVENPLVLRPVTTLNRILIGCPSPFIDTAATKGRFPFAPLPRVPR